MFAKLTINFRMDIAFKIASMEIGMELIASAGLITLSSMESAVFVIPTVSIAILLTLVSARKDTLAPGINAPNAMQPAKLVLDPITTNVFLVKLAVFLTEFVQEHAQPEHMLMPTIIVNPVLLTVRYATAPPVV